MKKLLSSCLILFLLLALMTGCKNDTTAPDTDQTETQDEAIVDEKVADDADKVDDVTGPSYVTDDATLESVMGTKGTWIVIFTEDMTTDKELVLDGEFKNDDKVVRKMALYAQDEERVKTARYTLTAPKLTVKSENAKIVGGTFKGDVYVEANGFTVEDGQIEGNVYFKNEEFKDSFKMTDAGKVTGTTEVK